jgi:multiple sugar transport system substrate-binding protein
MKLFRGWVSRKLAVAALFITAFGMTGCTHLGSPSIKISSWGDPKENAILTDLINDFQKAHPDIKVELQRVDWGNYNQKLLTQVAAGIAPDVIFVSSDNMADLMPRGILEPLNEYVKADNFPLGEFYPAIIDRFTVDGQLYVVPRDVSPICLVYYNKKAFDEAKLPYPTDDWTWSDLVADAKALTKRDESGKTERWGYTEDWPMPEPWIYSAGGRWVDNPQNPNQYTFNTPTFINALQFRTDLMLKKKVMPGPANMTAMGGLGASGLFVNGTAAMFLSGMWKVPQLREIKDFDWDVVMFPKGPTGLRGFQNGGSGYGILRSSKNKKEAWMLVKYLAGAEGEKKMATTGLAQPAMRSVAESSAFLDGQKPLNKKMLLKAEDYAVFEPRATNWAEIRGTVIGPVFDKLWTGDLTAAQAVSQLADQLKDKPLIVKLEETKQ